MVTGNTRIPVDILSKELNINIQDMKVGEISEPELFTLPGPDQKKAWRVFYLKSEIPPHRANLREDYQKLQAQTFDKKQRTVKEKWIEKARKEFYIQINGSYRNKKELSNWISNK
jgi:peptidyl-prolyl cis-trans isomerase SurA